MSHPQFTCAVVPQFLEEQSNPSHQEYAFSYTVTIVNSGDVAAQLIGRHWVITDATGHVEQVRGLGVVGHQPMLKPGEKFEYTSWTQLNTPHGLMQGTFFCMTDEAHPFDAPIEPFSLARSQSLH